MPRNPGRWHRLSPPRPARSLRPPLAARVGLAASRAVPGCSRRAEPGGRGAGLPRNTPASGWVGGAPTAAGRPEGKPYAQSTNAGGAPQAPEASRQSATRVKRACASDPRPRARAAPAPRRAPSHDGQAGPAAPRRPEGRHGGHTSASPLPGHQQVGGSAAGPRVAGRPEGQPIAPSTSAGGAPQAPEASRRGATRVKRASAPDPRPRACAAPAPRRAPSHDGQAGPAAPRRPVRTPRRPHLGEPATGPPARGWSVARRRVAGRPEGSALRRARMLAEPRRRPKPRVVVQPA